MKRAILLACALAAFPAVTAADSLWPEQDDRATCLVADDKAHRVGDVVTVIVQESQSVKNRSTLNLKKDTETKAEISKLKLPNDIKLDTTLGAGGDSSRKLDGEGRFEMDNSIETYVACLVIEVLPNGNLVIEGSRTNDVARDKQKIRVSGIVRPRDVSSENRIYSNQLADAKIHVETSGSITSSTTRGWLGKITDLIWPF